MNRHLRAEDLEGLSDDEKGKLIMNADSLTTTFNISKEDEELIQALTLLLPPLAYTEDFLALGKDMNEEEKARFKYENGRWSYSIKMLDLSDDKTT